MLDVFTRTALRREPLAVVLGADQLIGAQMQGLAVEFALSETVFPLAPTADTVLPRAREGGGAGPRGAGCAGTARDRQVYLLSRDGREVRAALGLAVHAVAGALLPAEGTSRFTVRQGMELGRPSLLRLAVDARVTAARVSGDVVRVSRGRIAVPPY